MGNHRYGNALAVLAVVVAAAFGLWTLATDRGAVFGLVGWTYVAWIAFAIVCGGTVLWLWLAARPLWASDRPQLTTGLVLREGWGPLHKPNELPEAPWLYICRLTSKKTFSPALFRVTVSEPAQAIEGIIWQHDKMMLLLELLGPGESVEGALKQVKHRAALKNREPTHATLDFNEIPLTPQDQLHILAWSTSKQLRITKVKRVKRES